jgi:thiosulfate reductase cytochrome b subunit
MVERTLRRGLPRVIGGSAWPPPGLVDAVEERGGPSAGASETSTQTAGGDLKPTTTQATVLSTTSQPPRQRDGIQATTALRRGLPRVGRGEPWPPVRIAEEAAVSTSKDIVAPVPTPPTVPAAGPAVATGARALGSISKDGIEVVLRRGLPRASGGEPWPPQRTIVTEASGADPVQAAEPVVVAAAEGLAEPESVLTRTLHVPDVEVLVPVQSSSSVQLPRPAEPVARRRRERRSWPLAARVALGAVALGVVAAAVAALVRMLLGTEPLKEFLASYPGEYHLPDGAPVGFPAWIGWQHFFNVFLMVLIIRSGLQVRSEKRPTVFWVRKGAAGKKISLALWFHQSLDILWLVNGAVFVVVLFASGQWMRIVPTSWDVFPNALSALLQYLSFNWPTEDGWVNYNSLQQLAYFTTVFLAAPLAAVTGFRMSGLWPNRAERLSRAYRVEWARAAHFPVMLYFVGFIVVHVFLVFTTGLLGNLNHMYASQDGNSWAGFWIFMGSVALIAVAWIGARPLFLVPIAKLFGKVSGR